MKLTKHINLIITVIALLAAVFIFEQHLGKKNDADIPQNKALPAAQESLPAIGKAMPAENGPKVGHLAPSFTIRSEDGTAYTVGGPRDKAVLLNFWASWCDPCQKEAPELNKIAEKYRDTLDIYGINVTSYDYKANAERFVKKYKLAFPVMFDLKGEVYAKYYGTVFPTNVLIDRSGVVSEIILGGLTAEEMDQKLKKLVRVQNE